MKGRKGDIKKARMKERENERKSQERMKEKRMKGRENERKRE